MNTPLCVLVTWLMSIITFCASLVAGPVLLMVCLFFMLLSWGYAFYTVGRNS